MTISNRVRQEFYHPVPQPLDQPLESQHQDLRHHHHQAQSQLIRLPPTKRQSKYTIACATANNTFNQCTMNTSSSHNQMWTIPEHERFLQALELFPRGPWKYIAAYVGNKTARQAMSHAQKYRQKIARRKRGLQINRGRQELRAAMAKSKGSNGPATQQLHAVYSTIQPQAQQNQAPTNETIPQTAVQCFFTTSQHKKPSTEVSCPRSPNEVSLPTTVTSYELDWTPFLPPAPHLGYHQHALQSSLAQQFPLDHCATNAPFDHLAPVTHLVGSFSDLLARPDDHEVILHSVSEFIDSMGEVEPFGLQPHDLVLHGEVQKVLKNARA